MAEWSFSVDVKQNVVEAANEGEAGKLIGVEQKSTIPWSNESTDVHIVELLKREPGEWFAACQDNSYGY